MNDTGHMGRVINRRSLLKFGAFGAATVTATALLTGCSSDPSDVPSASATGIEGVDPIQLGPDVEGVLYPDGYIGPRATVKEPFHDGSKTFKIGVKLSSEVIGDWNTNEYSKWMEERTGVKVEYEVVLNTDDDLTKVNAAIASGDMPDAYLAIPFTNDQLSLYGSQGVFQPLESLIETYAPEMRKLLAEDYPEWGAAITALDGHKYQMVAPNDCYHCRVSPSRAFINSKYLEAVGAEMPQTTEELREVLKLFKEQDPSGTGEMIPFAAGDGSFIDNYIMNSFMYNPGSTGEGGGWLRVNDGTVEFAANTDEWREALRYLRTLYDDGTLDRSAFTMTGDELLTAGNQGRLGFVRSYYWGFFADIDYTEGALWYDYVSIPPLEGPNGVRYANWNWQPDRNRPFVITSACENPEVLVQWADTMFELEGTIRGTNGNPDNWWWATEGEVGINGEQAVWGRTEWPAPAGTGWDVYSLLYNSNSFRLGQVSDPENPDLEAYLFEATQAYEPYQQPREMQLPPLIFDESQAATRADIAVTIENHVRSHMAEFAVAERDINDDAAWEEYVSAFDAIGLPTYIDLHQQTFDSRPT
jgi:putative aldouronate transport system substrate-binding protein